MSQELLKVVNELYELRLAQADAKERLLTATRQYEMAKAEAYLEAVGRKKAHFAALNEASLATAEEKAAHDKADMEHYRAWVECNNLVNQLSSMRGGYGRLIADDWEVNRPN